MRELIIAATDAISILATKQRGILVVGNKKDLDVLQRTRKGITYKGVIMHKITIMLTDSIPHTVMLINTLCDILGVHINSVYTKFRIVAIPRKKLSLVYNSFAIHEQFIYSYSGIQQYIDLWKRMVYVELYSSAGVRMSLNQESIFDLFINYNNALQEASKRLNLPCKLVEQLFHARNNGLVTTATVGFEYVGFTMPEIMRIRNIETENVYEVDLLALREEFNRLEINPYAMFWQGVHSVGMHGNIVPLPKIGIYKSGFISAINENIMNVNCFIEKTEVECTYNVLREIYSNAKPLTNGEFELLYNKINGTEDPTICI